MSDPATRSCTLIRDGQGVGNLTSDWTLEMDMHMQDTTPCAKAPLKHRPSPPPIPATFFGMVLGLGGLGNGWRAAARVWNAPDLVGEVLSLSAAAVWLAWLVLYGLKWISSREEAVAEFRHPIQAFFIALVPVATLIAGIAVAPYLPTAAWVMFVLGVASQVLFSAWAMGELWQGGRHAEATTPTLYMPTVGGCFVSAIACGAFGYPETGLLFFGAGFLSLVVLESIVLHRLMTHALPPGLRATLGLHLATPAVGSVAYLAVTDGPPDRFVQMLFGYALLQALVMLRLVPWLRQQPFSPAAWAYTFGVSALPLAALHFVERGQTGPIAFLGILLFVGANLVIGWIALRTVRLAVAGKLLPTRDPGAKTAVRSVAEERNGPSICSVQSRWIMAGGFKVKGGEPHVP